MGDVRGWCVSVESSLLSFFVGGGVCEFVFRYRVPLRDLLAPPRPPASSTSAPLSTSGITVVPPLSPPSSDSASSGFASVTALGSVSTGGMVEVFERRCFATANCRRAGRPILRSILHFKYHHLTCEPVLNHLIAPKGDLPARKGIYNVSPQTCPRSSGPRFWNLVYLASPTSHSFQLIKISKCSASRRVLVRASGLAGGAGWSRMCDEILRDGGAYTRREFSTEFIVSPLLIPAFIRCLHSRSA
ncbi:hypothetical protein C8R45DRAFT_1105086 [Mycena sanguinolenta]|nr:hypothetical protein C8R45DRAFT_1105086 [Mycena sanguinolenta]